MRLTEDSSHKTFILSVSRQVCTTYQKADTELSELKKVILPLFISSTVRSLAPQGYETFSNVQTEDKEVTM